jgi:uncharacterized GH25 family protein
MKVLIRTVITMLLIVSNVHAHSLWVNSFEAFAHKPGHTTVSIGWGHMLPIDDMTNAGSAKVAIEDFSITDPAGNKIELYKPEFKTVKPSIKNPNFDVFDADLATQKIALKENTEEGVYLIEASSKRTFFTKYINKKGKQKLALKAKDELGDIGKILFSAQYQAFAKSYLTIGKWKNPEPVGHGLEITPLSDLSNVRVGDLVEFDVRFNGKPLSYGPNGIEYITAHSSSFGLSDGFALFSYISKGKAQFRVQSAGQWLVNVFHNENVTKDGPLKKMFNKTNSINYGASLTFNVK